jgi:ATP-dependent Lhr-like helicase
VIVDEIHAVAGDKRGAHLALSLERLEALVANGREAELFRPRRVQRIGLSATQKPIEEIARLLVGTERVAPDGEPDCAIVDTGHRRAMELSIETTDLELGAITSHEMRATVYDRLVELIGTHRTTIVFVNTRRLVERVAHALGERLGAERVVAHHGSLSRRIRLTAEQKLKSGEVPVVVATASLELGIDVGHVDLVCHLGAPRALATLLQRVGRSGHWLGSVPKGIFFPLTRDELVQTAAAVRAIRQGELDRIRMAPKPLDILAQQIVATAAADEIREDDLWRLVHGAYSYRDLTRAEFDQVLEMLTDGVATRRGRRAALVYHDRVQGRVVGRRGARLAAITSGGAIPDTADYDVIEDPTDARVGKVNEDFAIESMRGDIFLLGNHSWRIRRVENGRVRVEDAGQAPPTIPFWMGEAPSRTAELSRAVAELRQEVADRLADPAAAAAWLCCESGLDAGGAEQLVRYLTDATAMLGTVPTCDRIVAERFFDESGGMQLILHAPFGGAINRALGLALRKRFCVNFDFELQAAATDDGVVISLGEQHSFPLDSVFGMVRSSTVEADLIQAALQAPMFGTRWRWNASRALAIARHQGGKRVPMNIQRMRAEDLLAAVFPAQLACGDNRTGPIEPPDHPLVNETLQNCLTEAMDVPGLKALLGRIERREIETVAVELPAPSPMAHEILNAYPYAFLDDAPLEERRARAVNLRRTDASLALGLGALDPDAIAEVRLQAWPDVRDADELHDALQGFVWLPLLELGDWSPWLDELLATRRATILRWTPPYAGREMAAAVSAECLPLALLSLPNARRERDIASPRPSVAADPESATLTAVRGWLECTGPTSVASLARRMGLEPTVVEAAVARLEADGFALRGRFTLDSDGEEWCERRLLARIHRLTLGRLRREIEPVSVADFMRFLLRWQHAAPGTQLHGREGLAAVIGQLHGLELPAPAWERSVLPLRVERYSQALLDDLCFSGVVAWGRLSPPTPPTLETVSRRRRAAPTRNAPIALALREELATLHRATPGAAPEALGQLSSAARDVLRELERSGASFLGEIAQATGLLPTAAEDALWELVAQGLVTGDGFAGLRTLLLPEDKRRRPERRLRALHGGRARPRSLPVGRWALLRRAAPELDHVPVATRSGTPPELDDAIVEAMAYVLLRRYGVVLREVLARETLAPPWSALLGVLRRMEMRGEVRGGRFVSGLIGEQYALPEAVDALRATRRANDDGTLVLLSAADPLNLVGILSPGARVSPLTNQVIAYARGVPLEVGELGAVRSRLQSYESSA